MAFGAANGRNNKKKSNGNQKESIGGIFGRRLGHCHCYGRQRSTRSRTESPRVVDDFAMTVKPPAFAQPTWSICTFPYGFRKQAGFDIQLSYE